MEELRNDRVAALVLKRLVVIVVLMAMVATVPTITRADSASPDLNPMTETERSVAASAARRSTVRVSATGCGRRVTGSGFVADGMLITNSHIVGDAAEVTVDRLDAPGAPFGSNARVGNRSTAMDLALVGFSSGDSLPLSTELPSPGEPVLLVGYGGGNRLSVIDAAVHSYVAGAAYGSEGTVLLLDRVTAVGFSGGPVLNRHGEVVGVLRAFDSVTGLSIAVPTAKVVELAQRAANDADERLC